MKKITANTPRKTRSLSLPVPLWNQIGLMADKENRSINNMVEQILLKEVER